MRKALSLLFTIVQKFHSQNCMIFSTVSARRFEYQKLADGLKLIFVSCSIFLGLVGNSQTYFPLSGGNYSEAFANISSWTNNYANASLGSQYWGVAATGTNSTVNTSTVFSSSTTGGVQIGTNNMVLLATSTNFAATDLYVDFTGRKVGTLSFDWAKIINSVNATPKLGALKIQYSTTGKTGTFTDLSGTGLPISCDNGSTAQSGTISSIALPVSLNNSQVIFRFYVGTSDNSGSGNRPKISIDNIAITSSAILQYYYNGAGPLNNTTSWSINSNGSGSGTPSNNPPDFSTSGQFFNLTNATSVTNTGAWTVGAGSKIIIGRSTDPAITLTDNAGISGVVDITAANAGTNTIVLGNTTIPTFGTLNAASTVNYAGTLQAIRVANYGNFDLTNAVSPSFPAGTVGIAGSFTIGSINSASSGTILFNGAAIQTIPTFAYNILNIANTSGSALSVITGSETGACVVNSGSIISVGVATTGFAVTTGNLLVKGTFNNSVTSATAFANTNAQLGFASGSNYNYNGGGATTNAFIAPATWNANSNILITGLTGFATNGITAPTAGNNGINTYFGNVTIDNPAGSQSNKVFGSNWANNTAVNIAGNLILGRNNTASIEQLTTGSGPNTFNILGNLIVYAGNWGVASFAGTTTIMNVSGSVIVDATNTAAGYPISSATGFTSPTLTLASNATAITTLNVGGNITALSGTAANTVTASVQTAVISQAASTTLPLIVLNAATGNQTITGLTGTSFTGNVSLTVNKAASGNMVLGGNLTIPGTGILTLTKGKAVLGANNLITTSAIGSANSSNYVVTDGAGNVTLNAAATPTVTTFHVGSSTSSYDPVTVKPTNAVSFAVKVKSTASANDFTPAIADFSKVAPRQWDVTPTGTAGSTELTLTNGDANFTPTTAVIGHYTGSAWEELAATYSANKWIATTTTFSPFGAGSAGGFVTSALAPTVTTDATPAVISTTSATLGGDVTSDGGATITARGIVWSQTATNATPAIGSTGVSNEVGSGTTGPFTVASLTAMPVNTQISYRAYATNSIGTSYGGVTGTTFYTLANVPSAPTVNNATTSSLDVAVNVNGNPSTTEFAINETTTGNHVQADGSLGATAVWQAAATWGIKTVSGLIDNTQYTFQVKARNGAGTETAFGSTASGTTISAAAPLATLTATPALTEANLNGSTFVITLANDGFVNYTTNPTDLTVGNFTLNNAPSGASITSVQATSATTATVTLAFTQADFDANVTNLNVTIAAAELVSTVQLTSTNLSISAYVETITVGSVTTFGNQLVSTPSAEKTYNVTGSQLLGNITVTRPSSDFEISGTSGSGFGASVILAPDGNGTLASTPVYVRFVPGSLGAKSGNITHTSTNAITQNVAVSGTGIASSTSTVTATGGYSYTSNIVYSTYTAGSTLTMGNSVGVVGLTLNDLGGDGLSTQLTGVTFTVPANTGAAIRAAALFDGSTNVAELTSVSGTSIAFSGLILSAADNNTKDFELRITFENTVTDNHQMQFTVSAVTASTTGSTFAAGNGGAAAASTTGDINRIEVTATNLVYTTNPPSTAGVGSNVIPAPVVAARDANGNTDADFGYTNLSVTNSAGLSTSNAPTTSNAVAGVLTFPSTFQFGAPGTTTLSVAATGVTTATSGNITVSFTPAPLATYTFTGTACSAAALAPSSVASNVSFSQASVTGETCNSNSGTSYSVGGTNWGTAFSATRYVEFTVTPANGYLLTVNSLTFDHLRTAAGATNGTVRSSADNFTADLITPFTVGTSAVNANVSLSGGSFTDKNAPITFRIYGWGGSSTGDLRLDNIILNGYVYANTNPYFSISSSVLSFASTNVGATSTSQTFDLSGANLTGAPGNITVTAPSTDFEVSTTSSTTGFGATAFLPYTGATLSATPVWVRFTPRSLGAKSGNVTFNGAGVTTYTQTVAVSGTAAAAAYYSKSTGNLELPATWGTNNDGSGIAPADFTSNGQTFNVVNQSLATIGAAWTVSGTSSKVIVGDGTNALGFTVPASFVFAGTADVTNHGTLVLQNATLPTLGALAAGSTVNYAGASQTVAVASYSNLDLTGASALLFPAGTVGVGQVFTPAAISAATQGTISFIGTTGQTIPSFAFNVLNINNTSGIALSVTTGSETGAVVINAGSTVSVGSTAGSLTRSAGNLLVKGKIVSSSATTGVFATSNAQLGFSSGSSYTFDGLNATTTAIIPAAMWNANSNILITGLTGFATQGITAAAAGNNGVNTYFGNITVDNPGAAVGNRVFGTNWAGNTTINIAGNLVLGRINSSSVQQMTSGSSTVNFNILGNLEVYAANWGFASFANASTVLNVSGSVIVDGRNTNARFANATGFTPPVLNLAANASAVSTLNVGVGAAGGDITIISGTAANSVTGAAVLASVVQSSSTTLPIISVVGTGTQTVTGLTGAGVSGNISVVINKASGGVTLGSDMTIPGTGNLTLTNGIVTTGSNKVIMPSTGTFTRTNGWVAGNFQKRIATGATSKTFEIGGAANYRPVTVAFGNATTAGDLTASVTQAAGEHPNVGTSGIKSDKDVNRYWNITNSGVVFNTADVTLNWVAGDLDAGTTTANFKVAKYDAPNWTLPTVANPLATSIQATGITSFSDFVVGEQCTPSATPTVSSPICAGSTSVSGSSSEADGTVIEIFDNGVSVGTTNVTANAWSLTVAALTAGHSITATATAVGGCVSATSSAVVVNYCGSNVWNGTGNWSNGAFWSAGHSPTGTLEDVVIATGTPTLDETYTLPAGKTLSITTGASLVVAPTKSLTIAGAADFNNQSVTFKSDPTGTGRLGEVSGTLVDADNVTVERYIPLGKRSYRQLASGVNSTSNIFNNWQTAGNHTAGRGIHITGSTTGSNGFDQTLTGAVSMFTYVAASPSFTPLANTDATNLNPLQAYRVFVIGDRDADLTIPNNTGTGTSNIAMNKATTLQATGTVVTGPVTFNSSGATAGALSNPSSALTTTFEEFSMIPNPYWSPVDFDSLTKTDVASTYWLWDPSMGNRGAYVSYNTTTGSSAGNITKDIQPGQSIFVQTTGGAPSVVFNEDDKSAGFTNTFRLANETPSKMRVKLYTNTALNTGGNMQDATMVAFRDDFNNTISNEDAAKFTNTDENIAIVKGNTVLGVEGRSTVATNDTIAIRLWKLFGNNSYTLRLDGADFDAGITGVLVDKKLNQQYTLNMSGSIDVPFAFSSSDSSSFYDRFILVFRTATVLPVSFTAVKAFKRNNAIQVEWNTATETNIKQYEVERSVDGRLFNKIGTVAAKASATGSAYEWLDLTPASGNNYYRIRSVANNAASTFSAVVRVNLNGLYVNSTIYPNPVKGSKFDWKLEGLEKGSYTIRLYNQLGQTLYSKLFTSQGGSLTETIELNESLATGVYTLILQNSFGTQRQQQLSIQN
jgi:hypothetical protein